MIDVSEILLDPDLCSEFVIQRTIGSFEKGGWLAHDPEIIPTFGAVRNTSGNELAAIPEADRINEMLTFRSVTQMFVTTANNADGKAQTSDVLIYQDETYRIVSVKNYSDQGFWSAVAARMAGN